MQVTRTQAIKNLLMAQGPRDLAELYSHDMECQVNVAQDGGERIEKTYHGKTWNGWSDGIQTWKPFRIPRNAKSDPEYQDVPMTFDLAAHAEGIGITGWDWVKKQSIWVAFDFDAIVGHSTNHNQRLNEAELENVKNIACEIPWVTVRKSTGGRGLHLYVFLDPVNTVNHNEHAALARAILSEMSAITAFDFGGKVDICGGNMWVWHRKMLGTHGLELIKRGDILTEIPPYWRDHLKVIGGNRKKSQASFLKGGDGDSFEALAAQRQLVELDAEHQKLINWLKDNDCTAWWESDHRALVTHTCHLLDAHKALNMRGVFNTESTHSSPQNCFCFPMRNGIWSIRRFSQGCKESASWTQDSSGWTMCYLNSAPDLKSVSRMFGGQEDKKLGFNFPNNAESASMAAKALGVNIDIPSGMNSRSAALRRHKDGRLIFEIKRQPDDQRPHGWSEEKGTWFQILDVKAGETPEAEVGNFDDLVRHIVTEAGQDNGWTIMSNTNWNFEPLSHIMKALTSGGLSKKDVDNVVGSSILKCWRLVNRPFQPEYPGGREWNRSGAKFRFAPSQHDDLKYPTWQRILDNCGLGLDTAVTNNGWCKENGILTGGDYLKLWIAAMFQEPEKRLPYLFFYGDQGSGKSMFHESIERLLQGGYERADRALTSEFNGELAKAVLCVVEETSLDSNKQAAAKIKDLVTADQISIRELYKSPYLIRNVTHWIQCSNFPSDCAIFPGDTRITMVRCRALDPLDPDPKRRMMPRDDLFVLLDKEAPDFLAEILKIEIPKSNDRLYVPVLKTDEKVAAERTNQNQLEAFLEEMTIHIDGEMIKCSDFYDAFWVWLGAPEAVRSWTKHKIGKSMPINIPKGRVLTAGGQFFFGNIGFNDKTRDSSIILSPLISRGDRLESANA